MSKKVLHKQPYAVTTWIYVNIYSKIIFFILLITYYRSFCILFYFKTGNTSETFNPKPLAYH